MKIPKYVDDLVRDNRLWSAPIGEQSAEGGVYGYVFRLYRLSNSQYDSTLEAEADRLVAWANREYADAKVLDFYGPYFWGKDNGVHKRRRIHRFTDMEHRKPYYKRDYILVSITDPVAQQIEKLMAQYGSGRKK